MSEVVSFDELFKKYSESDPTPLQKVASTEESKPSLEQLWADTLNNKTASKEEQSMNNAETYALYKAASDFVAFNSVQNEMAKEAAAENEFDYTLVELSKQAQLGNTQALYEFQKLAAVREQYEEDLLGYVFAHGVREGLKIAQAEGVNVPLTPENGGSLAPSAVPNDGTRTNAAAPVMGPSVNANPLTAADLGNKSLKQIADGVINGMSGQAFASGTAAQYPTQAM